MNSTDEERLLKYVIFSQIKGVGPVTQNAILDVCGDIKACFEVDGSRLMEHPGIEKVDRRRIETFLAMRHDEVLKSKAATIINNARRHRIELITCDDPRYPKRFEGIYNRPLIIYAKGNLKINEYTRSVGIVGARRCSAEGKDRAVEITNAEVLKNAAIISGMAKGIDSYAHTAVIRSKGYTFAVLAGGVDRCYPKEHQKLYEEIIRTGCVISEYPPGTQPVRHMFPMRNRIIAALSDELYVVDTGRNSGTDSTVAFCEKYGRAVNDMSACGICI